MAKKMQVRKITVQVELAKGHCLNDSRCVSSLSGPPRYNLNIEGHRLSSDSTALEAPRVPKGSRIGLS